MTTQLLRWVRAAALITVVGWATGAQAQTALVSTTLAAAVSTADATTVTLTSGTGVAAGSVLYIDKELLRVQSAVGGSTTNWNVVRGFDGTASSTHANGALVYLGVRDRFYRADVVPGTSCTATNELFFPHINPRTGQIAECEGGIWAAWKNDRVRVKDYTVRDSFDVAHQVMQDDGTAKSLTTNEVNIVFGSPLGAITYREEQNKTASSWIEINGYLDISGDGTNNEGVEIVMGNGTDPTLGQWLEVGTQAGCVAAAITLTDVSGTDELVVGFRQNEAFQSPTLHSGYTRWNTVGKAASTTAIVSEEEVAGATLSDTAIQTWADGETRALKVCMSKAGLGTAYVSDAFTPSLVLTDHPVYNPVPMTNSGATQTSGTGFVPFISFLHDTDVAEATRIYWIELTKLP